MKTNYHTHHHLCGHASGNAWDYVSEAIKKDLKIIRLTDHAPNANIHDRFVRMAPDELPHYLEDCSSAKRRAGEKIDVLIGLEVEFFKNQEEYYQDLHNHTDYLIHGQHYITDTMETGKLRSGFALKTKEDIYLYADFLVQAMESRHFSFLAHPDLYMSGYREWDKTAENVAHLICRAAKEHDMILEYNANGFRKDKVKSSIGLVRPYPRNEFWEIAKSHDVKTIFNSDCHHPNFLYDDVIREAEVEYQNLGTNHIEYLDIKPTKKR